MGCLFKVALLLLLSVVALRVLWSPPGLVVLVLIGIYWLIRGRR